MSSIAANLQALTKKDPDHDVQFFQKTYQSYRKIRPFEMHQQEIVHLRKPNASINELRAYLKHIPKQFHKRIIVHSHYKLVKEFDLKGIHLSEKTRKLKVINTHLKIISTSFHTTKDVLKSRRKYTYFFLSPVFDSISKHNYKSSFEFEDLKLSLKNNKNNIVALGGINLQNIRQVKEVGFYGAAVLGYIWESKYPIESYNKLLSKIE